MEVLLLKQLKVLIGCEYTGVLREAFRSLGHDAWSCDLRESLISSPYHYQGDVFNIINNGWDLMIAHPPCTHLACSGARWFANKQQEQKDALQFVQDLMNAPIDHIY